MHVVLHEPEIHYNAGNIGRTCAVTGCKLHLIGPLGFSLEDKYIKRAGMDYWYDLDIACYSDYGEFVLKNNGADVYMATTKGGVLYTDARFTPDVFLMFGKESAGIPEDILKRNRDKCVRIPMLAGRRSLNLANAVAIVVYEALRQNGFTGMEACSAALA